MKKKLSLLLLTLVSSFLAISCGASEQSSGSSTTSNSNSSNHSSSEISSSSEIRSNNSTSSSLSVDDGGKTYPKQYKAGELIKEIESWNKKENYVDNSLVLVTGYVTESQYDSNYDSYHLLIKEGGDDELFLYSVSITDKYDNPKYHLEGALVDCYIACVGYPEIYFTKDGSYVCEVSFLNVYRSPTGEEYTPIITYVEEPNPPSQTSEYSSQSDQSFDHNHYHINLDLTGGSYYTTYLEKEEYTDYIFPLEEPTKLGHIFYGWYDKDSDEVYKPGDKYNLDKDTTLYALWGEEEHACHNHQTKKNIECSTCDGTGKVNDYNKKITCTRCNGKGTAYETRTCDVCFGINSSNRYGTCQTCGAYIPWGVYKCNNCKVSSIKWTIDNCKNCNGTGKVSKLDTCSSCYGSGQIPTKVNCNTCHGVGNYDVAIKCPTCLGEHVFSGDPAPIIEEYDSTSIKIKEVAGYEYAVTYVANMYNTFEENLYHFNLGRLSYQNNPTFTNLEPLTNTYSCYLIVMRKKSNTGIPNLPSNYAMMVKDKNGLSIYSSNNVKKNYSYKMVDPALGKFKSGLIPSESGHLRGLDGKEVALISGKNPDKSYAGGSHYSISYIPTAHYALTRDLQGDLVQIEDNKIYSTTELTKCKFSYNSTYKDYTISVIGEDINYTLFACIDRDRKPLITTDYGEAKNCRDYDFHWSIQQTTDGNCYLYCMIMDDYFNTTYVYLTIDENGVFSGSLNDNQCYPFYLAE